MKPGEAAALWEKVKENQRALTGCAGPHDFSEDLTPDRQLGKRWRCRLCRGEVDGVAKAHYLEGVRHGEVAATTTLREALDAARRELAHHVVCATCADGPCIECVECRADEVAIQAARALGELPAEEKHSND